MNVVVKRVPESQEAVNMLARIHHSQAQQQQSTQLFCSEIGEKKERKMKYKRYFLPLDNFFSFPIFIRLILFVEIHWV